MWRGGEKYTVSITTVESLEVYSDGGRKESPETCTTRKKDFTGTGLRIGRTQTKGKIQS